ncbi:hypothetical protein [Phenylobacterium sp. VNQ135]|uniref:hypothetical protein n=1 Tax=Phenylobacterium sp. VNQ135 TaxID=3400922 RepID=UPI003C30EB22
MERSHIGGQDEGEFFLPLDRKSLGFAAVAIITAAAAAAVVGWVQLAATALT